MPAPSGCPRRSGPVRCRLFCRSRPMRRSIRLPLPAFDDRAPRARGPAHAVIETFGAALAAPRPTAPAGSARPAPNMSSSSSATASRWSSMRVPARSGLSRPSCRSRAIGRSCFAPAVCRRSTRGGARRNPRTRVGGRSGHRARDARQPLRAAPAAPARRKLVAPDEALLSFGPGRIPGEERIATTRNLSPSGDLVEAAANLFAFLVELDRSRAVAIAVAPIPQHGFGEAINDRLERAAAPRPTDR